MRPTRRFIIGSLAVALAAAGTLAGVWWLSTTDQNSSFALHLGTMRASLDELPKEPLSQEEQEGILTLREGAKLARDTYNAFARAWELPVFASNAFNTQTHSDAVLLLIERYGLRDPVAGRPEGQYATAQFRDLYLELQQDGAGSAVAALTESLRLEELGVISLKNLLAGTENQDLQLVYTALLRSAALNLRDLFRVHRETGAPRYRPQHMSQAELSEVLRTPPESLEASSLFLRATDFGRCGIDDVRRPVRRQRDDSPPRDEALQQELCSVEVSIAGSATKAVQVGQRQIVLRLISTSPIQLPAPADSNSPAYWRDGVLNVFNSWDDVTYLSTGNDVENLSNPVRIQLPRPERPGNVWLEAVWKDPQSSVLYGWYHLEPSDLPCAPLTAPVIGAAVSLDGGMTWEDRGPVLESAYDYDCDYRNGYFVGGNGDFSVIAGQRGRYFYFLFSNYAGPTEEQGVAVARSLVSDRGQPGTLQKLYRGAWSEPGLGGKATAIFASTTGWKGPHVESFWGPSVHWNAAIQTYVALLNHTNDDGETWKQEGVYITFSTDLITWTAPEKILEANSWYPQVIGLSRNGTDSFAEQYMRVYVGGTSRVLLEVQ